MTSALWSSAACGRGVLDALLMPVCVMPLQFSMPCACHNAALPLALHVPCAVHGQAPRYLPDRQAAQQEARVQGHAARVQAGAGPLPGTQAALFCAFAESLHQVGVAVCASWCWDSQAARLPTVPALQMTPLSTSSPPHPQVRKSVKLKLLTRIEAYVDSPGQQEYFELAFAQVSGSHPAWLHSCAGCAAPCRVCNAPAHQLASCLGARQGVACFIAPRHPVMSPPSPSADLPPRPSHPDSAASPAARRGLRLRLRTRPPGWSCWARSLPFAGTGTWAGLHRMAARSACWPPLAHVDAAPPSTARHR